MMNSSRSPVLTKRQSQFPLSTFGGILSRKNQELLKSMQSVSTMPLFTSNKRMSVQLNSPKEQVPVQTPSISSDPHHFSLLMSSRRSRDKNCSTLCTKIPSFLKTSTVGNQASRTLINHTQILGSQDR